MPLPDKAEITVRVPLEMKDQLRVLGALRGETIGVVIRALIRAEIERADIPAELRDIPERPTARRPRR